MSHVQQLRAAPAQRPAATPARSADGMRDAETLTSLIGLIYDAALDASLWPEALAKIGDFVGGHGVGLLSKDSISRASTPHQHSGVDPGFVQVYADTHSKFDPAGTLPFFDAGQIVSFGELVPYDEFRRGRFFQEWMRPQGWVDAANSVLEKSATGFSFMSILRDETRGPVDDEMRSRVALISPHVRRAVLIGNVIDLRAAEAATFADILDGLSASLFLVAADGRIVHANTTGQAMLSAGDVLRSRAGQLVTRGDKRIDDVLQTSLAAANDGDAGIGVKGIAVPLSAADGARYVAHVLPLTAGARKSAGRTYTATAAVFVRRAALETPPAPEIIAKTYKLTPTELRVLLAVVEIGGVPDVASALDVAETTIKTHLKRLFEKTGAGRQADLVKLVAGYATPLTN